MTIEEMKAMSDEKVRAIVATLCGWTPFVDHSNSDFWFHPREQYKSFERTIRLPRYTEDLNACVEFENSLTDEQYERYSADLWRIVNPDDIRQESHPIRCERAFLSATARQRCEAFILTMESAVCTSETLS